MSALQDITSRLVPETTIVTGFIVPLIGFLFLAAIIFVLYRFTQYKIRVNIYNTGMPYTRTMARVAKTKEGTKKLVLMNGNKMVVDYPHKNYFYPHKGMLGVGYTLDCQVNSDGNLQPRIPETIKDSDEIKVMREHTARQAATLYGDFLEHYSDKSGWAELLTMAMPYITLMIVFVMMLVIVREISTMNSAFANVADSMRAVAEQTATQGQVIG